MKYLFLIIGLSFSMLSDAQPGGEKQIHPDNQQNKEAVLLTINDKKVTLGQFEKIYKKSKNDNIQGVDQKELDEYLELFINYRLKVTEAENLGMDTSESFLKEYTNYRKQFAKPFLEDKNITIALVHEAYERMQKEVKASHLLIRLQANADASDTLIAYNKIMNIRTRILKGDDFARVAMETSEDQSVKQNNGDLGYFTVFRMVYPFETAAYTTPVGQVSMPVRTSFGYHLVKVQDVRPAQGQVMVAHIMIQTPKGASSELLNAAKKKFDEVYAKVKAGDPFDRLAREYSDDKRSANKGGELMWFGSGKMVPEFEQASFALKNIGDISSPLKTEFGFHIIKLLGKKQIGTLEENKEEIEKMIENDIRSYRKKEFFINRVKKEYNFTDYPKAKSAIYAIIDSSLLKGTWSAGNAKGLNAPLFTLQDKKFTQQEFANYVVKNQSKKHNGALQNLKETLYAQFVETSCIDFEESRLDLKYPDFKSLMDEYRDGILLFELTDQKVWTKAVKDSAGLNGFYEKNKSKYVWPDRLEASIYRCKNEEVSTAVRKLIKKKMSTNDILAGINKDVNNNVIVEEGKFIKGENITIDSLEWKAGVTKNFQVDTTIVFVNIKQKLPPQNKTLEEARGLIIADYQAFLEKQWLAELRSKYLITVHKDVLSGLKEN